jgi:hypothetical protein
MRKEWLQNAERDGRELLTLQGSDLTVLYASFRHLLIVPVFVPEADLKNGNKDDLYNARVQSDDAWCIQRAWGGGEGHRIYLEPPLQFGSGHPLKDAEPIVFRRSFEGMPNFETPIEVSQKLVHSLGLHFIQGRNAFCRLNDDGNVEEVVYVFQESFQYCCSR